MMLQTARIAHFTILLVSFTWACKARQRQNVAELRQDETPATAEHPKCERGFMRVTIVPPTKEYDVPLPGSPAMIQTIEKAEGDVVLFSETSPPLGTTEIGPVIELGSKPITDTCAAAGRAGKTVIFGAYTVDKAGPQQSPKLPYNSAITCGKNGKVIHVYHKNHLFEGTTEYQAETGRITPGKPKAPYLFEGSTRKWGTAICADIYDGPVKPGEGETPFFGGPEDTPSVFKNSNLDFLFLPVCWAGTRTELETDVGNLEKWLIDNGNPKVKIIVANCTLDSGLWRAGPYWRRDARGPFTVPVPCDDKVEEMCPGPHWGWKKDPRSKLYGVCMKSCGLITSGNPRARCFQGSEEEAEREAKRFDPFYDSALNQGLSYDCTICYQPRGADWANPTHPFIQKYGR